MIIRIAELDIDPAQLVAYKALLAEEIEASVRVEPGVIFLHGVSLKDAPHKIRMMECYASEEAYQSHLRSAHFLTYKTQTTGMVLLLTLMNTDLIAASSKAVAEIATPGSSQKIREV
jgi:quinol monooxygenase YgiN